MSPVTLFEQALPHDVRSKPTGHHSMSDERTLKECTPSNGPLYPTWLPFPAAGVLYRIQSAESGSYLELYDVDDDSVVMRPINDTLEQQASTRLYPYAESLLGFTFRP
jgi:hypothetical protein